MKILTHVVIFLIMGLGISHATPELDALEAKIRAEVPGAEWQVVKDRRSLTLTRNQVQFLNPNSLPDFPRGDELWKQYSFTSDYRITITFDTQLTQTEYEALLQLKRKFIADRTAGAIRGTKDFAGRRLIAQDVVRLPNYHFERFSVYVYTSDDNLFLVRPDSVILARDKVLAILEKSFLKYSMPAEPAGAANGSQPFRSQTNSTPPAAVSRS